MMMNRIFAIALRQIYLMRGSISRVIPLFLWVAIDMILWGFITKYLNRVTSPGMDFVPTLLGAVIFWDFFIRVLQGVTTAFFEDVWSRNFLNMFATPLKTSEYLAGFVLISIGTSAVGLVVMMVLAGVMFDLRIFAYGYLLFPILLSLFLMGISFGILACAMVLRLGPSAEWFVWPIPAILAPFSGVFYPISTLPSWMQTLSKILPSSYVFESMRTLINGAVVPPSQVALAIGIATLYVIVAGWVFGRVFQGAVRSGLLARYSAESVL